MAGIFTITHTNELSPFSTEYKRQLTYTHNNTLGFCLDRVIKQNQSFYLASSKH
jgi:hypothetical protein